MADEQQPPSLTTSHRRAAADFSGGQMADVGMRDAVGGDQHNVHDPAPWLAFFREYIHSLDQARTLRDEQLRAELGEGREEIHDLAERFSLYQQLVANKFAVDTAAAAARDRVTRLIATAALVVAVVALGLALL